METKDPISTGESCFAIPARSDDPEIAPRRGSRGLRRLASYTWLGSALTHGLIGWTLFYHGSRPVPDIGFEHGQPIQLLAPLVPTRSLQQQSAWSARRGGALETVDVEIVEGPRTVIETPGPSTRKRPPETKKTKPKDLPAADLEGEGGDSQIRVHLREDWTVEPSSPMATFSDRFNPLRVIVPEYPKLAVEQDIEGLVTLEADVGTDGKIANVHVVSAKDGILALAASQALLLWEFRPLVVHDQPRSFKIVVPFRFRIDRSS